MGWFDSKYEAHGSSSLSQIGQQRFHGDTYIGDLILSNTKTGKNIATNIREEIMHGTTSFLRRYYKEGVHKGFTSTLSFPRDMGKSTYITLISVDRDIASLQKYDWGYVDSRRKGLGANTNYELGFPAKWLGAVIKKEQTYMYDSGFDTYEAIQFVLANGTTVNTDIRANDDKNIGDGFIAEYTSSTGTRHYYYSSDKKFDDSASGGTKRIELMPVVAIKDNRNTQSGGSKLGFDPREVPYYLNPDGSQMRKDKNRVVSKLGADLDEISKSIFEPDPIDKVGSPGWKKNYGKMWSSAKKACARGNAAKDQLEICKFSSEQAWHDDMVKNQNEQKQNTRSITDVYFGFFVSMKTLDMANATALFLTLQPLMGTIKKAETRKRPFVYNEVNGAPERSYRFGLTAGTLKIDYSMSDYTYIRRRGTVKYGWESSVKQRKKKTSFKIAMGANLDERDPIIKIIKNKSTSNSTWNTNHDLCLELRMQDVADSSGNPTYLEIRLYGLWAEHYIDVMRDGKYGKPASVAVRGGLALDMDAVDGDGNGYTDVIVFPISKYAVDEMPIFMRERFSREALCLIVDGITVQKIKWYQKGWFKVFMFLVAVVLSVWTGGQSFTAYNLIIAALKMAVVMVVAQVILSSIDNPLLAAIIVVVLAVVTGNYNFSSFKDLAMLAVEATGTYLQKKMTQDMLKLQEEARDFQREMSEAKKEMEKLEEESGLNHKDDSDLIHWLSTLPPIEEANDWFNRVLNRDLNKIDLDNKINIESKLDL